MTVKELTRDELACLKADYLDEMLYEREGRGASYGEIADADEIVSDETVFRVYRNYDFTHGDFTIYGDKAS